MSAGAGRGPGARPMRVLFLCSHNSARSQMAEALLRTHGGGAFIAESAGTEARGVHPLAVRAMAEIGIDITAQRSKTVDELSGDFDVVITVCDVHCPIPPPAPLRLEWPLADPSAATGGEEERLAAFRTVRDALAGRIRVLIERVASHRSLA